MSRFPATVVPAAVLAISAFVLAACQTAPPGTSADAVPFDRQFLDEMSAHHAGAIALGQLAQRQASTDHVKTMANTLVAKQQEELQKLQGWRTSWYGPGPAPAPRDKDRHSMDELARLSGPAFDRAYITKIIEHHQEGIAMATPATHHAEHAEVKAFAQQMIADQTHEIEHLRGHLGEPADHH
jgi:uncharacterized protein (DUF305 family)